MRGAVESDQRLFAGAAMAEWTNKRRGRARARFVVVEEDVLVFHERHHVQRLRRQASVRPARRGLGAERAVHRMMGRREVVWGSELENFGKRGSRAMG